MAQQDERPATLSKLVGKQVKLHLFLKEMSGRDLAGKLGVSPSWVSYRLSGKQEIGLDDLFQIATVLGVDLDELITPEVKAKATEVDKGANRNFDRGHLRGGLVRRRSEFGLSIFQFQYPAVECPGATGVLYFGVRAPANSETDRNALAGGSLATHAQAA